MTTATQTPAAATAPKAAKTPKAPKAKADPKPAKVDPNGGLRKAQVRILLSLAKSSTPLTRKELAEKAPVDQAACVEYVGSTDATVRAANDKKHFPSLVTLKLVKIEDGVSVHADKEGVSVYSLTAAGKQRVEKLKAAGATGK